MKIVMFAFSVFLLGTYEINILDLAGKDWLTISICGILDMAWFVGWLVAIKRGYFNE